MKPGIPQNPVMIISRIRYNDRYSKKWIIIASDTGIAVTSLLLAYFFHLGDVPVWLILLMLAVRSLGTAFHEPTAQTLTPLIVPKESLTRYAGFAQAFESISFLLSPSLSVLVYQAWEMEAIMIFDAVGAGVAVAILLCIPIPKEVPKAHIPKKLHVIQETKEGFAIMREISGIFSLMMIGFLYTALYSPVGSLYPLITIQYFQGTTAQSGFVEVIFSAGTLLGALLLGKLGNQISKYWGLLGSIFIYGLGAFLTGCLPSSQYLIFVAISFFMGMSTPFYHGISRAVYQLNIPQEYLGRAFALSQSVRRLGMPLGLLISGPFSDTLGVHILYRVAGVFAMVLAVVGSRFSGIRSCCEKK